MGNPWRLVMYRSDTDKWFVYKERFDTEDVARSHGERMRRFQPSWDFRIVRDDAAYGICLLLNK
jgi:hypothetical protein